MVGFGAGSGSSSVAQATKVNVGDPSLAAWPRASGFSQWVQDAGDRGT